MSVQTPAPHRFSKSSGFGVRRLATLFLGLAAAAQLVYLGWACMTQWANHLDADASNQLMRALLMVREGSPSLSGWTDTTTLQLDTPLVLAALFYPLFGDIFTAHGAAVLLLDLALAALVWRLLGRAGAPVWGRLLALLLLLCPYGDSAWLSYANCVVVQSGHYSIRLIYMLSLLCVLPGLHERAWRQVLSPRGLAGPLLCLLLGGWVGISSGSFLLLLVVLPVLAFYLLWILAANRPRLLGQPAFVFLAGSAAAVLAGTWVQHNVIHFYGRDASIAWVGYTDLLGNLAAVIQGYCKLLGALPADSSVPVLSGAGLLYGTAWAVALALPFGLFWAAARGWREVQGEGAAHLGPRGLVAGALCAIAVVDLFICGSAALAYGEETYEARYLIFAVVSLFLLVALWLPALPLPGLTRPMAAVAAAVCVCGVLLKCDAGYARPTYDYSLAQQVTAAIDAAYPDVQIVYMASDDMDRRVLRVADPTRYYYLIAGPQTGDYTALRDPAGADAAGTLLLCTETQYAGLPDDVRMRYQKTALTGFWLSFDRDGVTTENPAPYDLYYCASGGIDLDSLAG